MKHLLRLVTCALLCAWLSPFAHGVRVYDASVCSVDELSQTVNRVEENPDCTVIVRTNGMKPDFRFFHPRYAVQGPEDTYVVCFADEVQARESMHELNRTNGVLYAEPNGIVCAQADEKSSAPHSWGVDYMQLRALSEQLSQTQCDPVTVAVVDSGIAAQHPLFAGRIADGASFLYEPYDEDEYGHGTAVAGVVADCTEGLPVDFLIVKVLDSYGNGSLLNAANGIRMAAERGADIINISFVSKMCSQYLHDAVQYALSMDSLPVIAAGNYNLNMDKSDCCPSHMTEPVVVSGCDSNGERYRKSCYGSMVDVCAPAVRVACASTDGDFVEMSGTSFAAPHISAAAALYKLYDGNADCARLTTLLLSNTRDLGDFGFDVRFGWGVPDLSGVDIHGSVVTEMTIETLPYKTDYTYKETFDPAGLSVRLFYADGTQSVRSHGLTLTGTDHLRRGENTVTVTYGGQTDMFQVHVQMQWWQWLIKILLFGWIWY